MAVIDERAPACAGGHHPHADREVPEESAEGFAEEFEVSWTQTLEAQFGSAPWWLISSVMHVVVLLALSLIVVAGPARDVTEALTIIDSPQQRPEPPMTPQPIVDEHFLEHTNPVTADVTILTHFDEPDIDEEFVTDNNADDNTARGDPEEISDVPMHQLGTVSFLGAGGGGGGCKGTPWGRSNRRGRTRGWGPNRGPKDSGPTLDRALEWLARHQEPTGFWDAEKHKGKNCDVGVTGLALLAFLGAGHSERVKGRYRSNVRRAVTWLVSKQQPDGSIGRGYEGGLGYHHAIAGLALAEAYGMGKVRRTGAAAQKAVDYSLDVHQKEYSGWRYKAGTEPDMSVTGWFVMQLKSALMAELRVGGEGFQGAVAFLDECTKDGNDYPGMVSYKPERSATTTMTSVGAVSRLFMGWKPNDPLVIGAAHEMAANLPEWEGNVNFYYWYYGTLAMFQVGGDFWKSWNVPMRDMLVERQRRGEPAVDGSWDPAGHWCGRGGRVFSTAMGALCLEIYWRYPVMLK